MNPHPHHPGRSEVAGPAPDSPADTGTLPVSETFTSIQGEGRLTGIPSYFVRLSGCNLRCAWCDTPYASWNPQATPRTVAEITQEYLANPARHVVITGGEPMIFPQLQALASALAGSGAHITIETAGTVFRDVACDLMSISPKLSGSAPQPGDPRDPTGVWRQRHEERRINIPELTQLIERYPVHQLKFVVSAAGDLQEIREILGRLPPVAPEDVLLMPEGVSQPPAELCALIAQACMASRWRYCHRLHITLFGNTRGT